MDTFLLILQNDAAAAKWPVTDQVLDRLTLVSAAYLPPPHCASHALATSRIGLSSCPTNDRCGPCLILPFLCLTGHQVSERFYHRDAWKGREVKPSTVPVPRPGAAKGGDDDERDGS